MLISLQCFCVAISVMLIMLETNGAVLQNKSVAQQLYFMPKSLGVVKMQTIKMAKTSITWRNKQENHLSIRQNVLQNVPSTCTSPNGTTHQHPEGKWHMRVSPSSFRGSLLSMCPGEQDKKQQSE